ncbi:MAG: DUF488 family protein [Alphaproteobacteria bacterium]
MAVEAKTIYTIGHSNHSLAHFLELLTRHFIRRLVDVRGRPFSRFNPHFNRERLSAALGSAGIEYHWSGEQLSGRPTDPDVLDGAGKPDWARVSSSPGFCASLGAVIEKAGVRSAVMCAEEDPRRCHRRFLLTPPMVALGVEVLHIRGGGQIESETALRAAGKDPQGELFEA